MKRFMLLALMLLIESPPAFADGPDVNALEEAARASMQSGDWAGAREALETLLEQKPGDAGALYDLAVALAQLGEADAATGRLIEALKFGFIDLHRIERDGRLAPVRETAAFRAIIAGWRDLLDARAEVNEESLRRLLGAGYHFQRDPDLRLLHASAFNEKSFAVALEEIDAVAAWAFANLFEAPDPSDPRPPPWVSVILPTPEHFLAFMMQLGAGPNVGGLYDHDRSQLICQDIGPSLRHEFLHVLHWRLLARTGQRHPDWIMEGFGALVEDMDRDEGAPGGWRAAPSWRMNIAKRLLDLGRLLPLTDLTTMERRVFRSRRPNANYAQARAFMMYLSESRLLTPFFRDYVEAYEADPTGVASLERAFGKALEEIEEDYRAWLAELPFAPEEIRPGMASLGVIVAAGRGDGPVIDEVVAGTPARRSGLRLRDVILSVDGRSTRTLPDLVRVLGDYEPGQTVRVEVRRGSRRLAFDVTLVER